MSALKVGLVALLLIAIPSTASPFPSVSEGYTIEPYVTGIVASTGIAIGPDGALYIADYAGDRVLRSSTPGAYEVLVSELSLPTGVAFNSEGRLFVVASTGPSSAVYEIIGDTAIVFASGFSFPTAIAAKGSTLYVTNSGDGTISAITSAGDVSTVLSGLGNPFAIAFDAAGTMYYVDHAGGALYSYNFVDAPRFLAAITPYGGTGVGLGIGGQLFYSDQSLASVYVMRSDGTPAIVGSGFTGADSPPVVGPNQIISYGSGGILVSDGSTIWKISSRVPMADVPLGHWAYTFIERLALSGITAGCGGGNFCPNDPVTRAQMAVFLLRGIYGADFRPPAALGTVFNDVSPGSFAASFIEKLYADRISVGCAGGNFCPNATITRDQMAVFLLRAKHGSSYAPPPPTGLFSDVPVNYWAAAFIEQLAREGVTSGCGGGKFCPGAWVTRDQMAVFLVRTFGL